MSKKNERPRILAAPPRPDAKILAEQSGTPFYNPAVACLLAEELWTFAHNPTLTDTRNAFHRLMGFTLEGHIPPKPDLDKILEKLQKLNDADNATRSRFLSALEEVDFHMMRWRIIAEEFEKINLRQQLQVSQESAAITHLVNHVGGGVVVFGSARLPKESNDYLAVEWLCRVLVEGTISNENGEWRSERIISGAGPGIMEAANAGAMNGARNALHQILNSYDGIKADDQICDILRVVYSVGIRIHLPFEAGFNNHVQRGMKFVKFADRKKALLAVACGRSVEHTEDFSLWHGRHPAIIVANGGIGTKDEFWEAMALIQCRKAPKIPIFVLGKSTHSEITSTMLHMLEEKTISEADIGLFIPCDNEKNLIVKYFEWYKLGIPEKVQTLIDQHTPLLK